MTELKAPNELGYGYVKVLPDEIIFSQLPIENENKLPVKYIINNGATILFWEDGTKTIVKRAKGDSDDVVKSFLWAYFEKTSRMSKTKANKYLKKIVDDENRKKLEILRKKLSQKQRSEIEVI